MGHGNWSGRRSQTSQGETLAWLGWFVARLLGRTAGGIERELAQLVSFDGIDCCRLVRCLGQSVVQAPDGLHAYRSRVCAHLCTKGQSV